MKESISNTKSRDEKDELNENIREIMEMHRLKKIYIYFLYV